MALGNSIRRMFVTAISGAVVMLVSQATFAITNAELEEAREEIKALVAQNHAIRSRYVVDGARFAKSHRSNPLVYDVGAADDRYEGALGEQSHFIGGLGVVADSALGIDHFGMSLDVLPGQLKKAQDFENEVIAKYEAVRNTKLSKSDRACYERQVEAARRARQVNEETLLIAVRYVALFGGGTPEEYAERKRRSLEASNAYYAEQAERRKITDESAALLLILLAALAYSPSTP
jgi:hypothetical protein